MQHSTKTEEGVIVAVFAHRFVLTRPDGTRLLADLGPEGAEAFALIEGLAVSIEGKVKPSELKVSSITPRGGARVLIPGGKPHHDPLGADPAGAMAAVERIGLTPVGQPHRKPKHFEVLARRGDDLVEVHVELDGVLRKEKPADRAKWHALAGGSDAAAA
jgi:hypothetical protein